MAVPFLLLGLGNPGPRFTGTRHNVGFDFVEAVAKSQSRSLKKQLFRPVRVSLSPSGGAPALAEPLTYMNRSGAVVPWLLQRSGIDLEKLVVVVDNMDLPPGEVRMKRRGSPASHNGLKSISAALGSDDYPRIYLGVGRPAFGGDVIEHVLGSFSEPDRHAVDAAMKRLIPLFRDLQGREIEQLISDVNARRRP